MSLQHRGLNVQEKIQIPLSWVDVDIGIMTMSRRLPRSKEDYIISKKSRKDAGNELNEGYVVEQQTPPDLPDLHDSDDNTTQGDVRRYALHFHSFSTTFL